MSEKFIHEDQERKYKGQEMFTLPWTSTRGIYLNNWLAMNLTFKFYLTGTGWIQYIPSTSPPLLKLGLLIFWLTNFIPDSIWFFFLRVSPVPKLNGLENNAILIGPVSFWPSCVNLHTGWPSQNSLSSTYRHHQRMSERKEKDKTQVLPLHHPRLAKIATQTIKIHSHDHWSIHSQNNKNDMWEEIHATCHTICYTSHHEHQHWIPSRKHSPLDLK